MTRLSIRLKSFYVIIGFLFVVFLFSPLKTFATNIKNHDLLIQGTDGDILTAGNTRTIYSNIINDTTQTLNTSVTPTGFYCVNSSCYSKVFNTAIPLMISHTVYWQSSPTTGKSAPKTFYAGSSELLQLEITSDVQIHPNTTLAKVLKTDFFKNGIKTLIGNPIGSGTIPNGVAIWAYPKYSFIVRSVLPPSISSFTASAPAFGSNGSYKLISGNSVTLNWTVNQATATTRCELHQEGSLNSIKTFDNTDADATNDFTLSGATKSFSHTISSVTASATYKVSCSHNGLGITPQSQINITVVPVPSVTKFLVKNASGAALADGRHQNAEKIGDDDQSKYSRRRTALSAGAKFDL